VAVVTLFESYGCGADVIGRRVAETLGVPYHEQAFSSEQLEEQEEAREQESLLSRLVVAMGRGSATDHNDVPLAQQDKDQLVSENTALVSTWAETGGVILGRNGAFILRGLPNALHVRLDAPVEQRIARAAADRGIPLDRARRRQRREDEMRAQMSRDFYAFDPTEPLAYDLVINTGTVDADLCVAIIAAAARSRLAVLK
jgi:cytidylate kinase